MDWTEEPATDRQVSYLRRLGYQFEHPLKKSQAAQLIRDYLEASQRRAITSVQTDTLEYHPEPEPPAHAESPVATLTGEDRQDFWIDTCREIRQMHLASPQAVDLYRQHGCRFEAPTRCQVQEILGALD